MKDNIIALDHAFNFKQAYKRNYCTLLNVKIVPADLRYPFMLDGVQKVLSYPHTVYQVMYREFLNTNYFPFDFGSSNPKFWSSEEQAKTWFDGHLADVGLEILTEDQAFQAATLLLESSH